VESRHEETYSNRGVGWFAVFGRRVFQIMSEGISERYQASERKESDSRRSKGGHLRIAQNSNHEREDEGGTGHRRVELPKRVRSLDKDWAGHTLKFTAATLEEKMRNLSLRLNTRIRKHEEKKRGFTLQGYKGALGN